MPSGEKTDCTHHRYREFAGTSEKIGAICIKCLISIICSFLSLLIILVEVWSVARKYVFNPPKIRFLNFFY
jgi:hypothetical protein